MGKYVPAYQTGTNAKVHAGNGCWQKGNPKEGKPKERKLKETKGN